MPLPQPAPSVVLPVPDGGRKKVSLESNAADIPAGDLTISSAPGVGNTSDTALSTKQQVFPATHAAAAAVPSDLSLPFPRGTPDPLRTPFVREADTSASPFELAFSLRLRPLLVADAPLSPAPGSTVRPEVPAAAAAFLRPDTPPIVPGAPAAEAQSPTAATERNTLIPHVALRQPRPADTELVDVSVPTAEHATPLHFAGVVRSPGQEIQPETPRSEPEPHPAGTVEPRLPEMLKAPAPIRSLELQLDSNQGRVAVRLAEQAGDVKVDVRTADNRLASALRDELPSLAARIEQSGYRAEMWHPSASPGPDRGRVLESAASAGDSQNLSQGGHRNAQEQERRGWTDPKQPSPRKNNGKDFQWLFTSIR